MSISSFLTSLKINFKDLSLFQRVFVHSSYANENKNTLDYEQLEFLGDSLIGYIVSEYLYKNWKKLKIDFSPEFLSKFKHFLVSSNTLSEVAQKLEMKKLIITSKNLPTPHKNPKIMSSVFEALIAAIYLDQSLKFTRDFLIKHLIIPFFPSKDEVLDYRQELLKFAKKHSAKIPTYSEIKQNEEYFIKCHYKLFQTQGKSKIKKKALQKAAKEMLILVKNKNLELIDN